MAEDRIAVAQQVAGELGKGKCLPQLLGGPLRGRVSGNIEVQNAPSVMGQHQKQVKNLEANRGHGEEIDGDQLLDMILEEGAPSLRGRFMAAHHVFADAALSDVDAESPWMRGAPLSLARIPSVAKIVRIQPIATRFHFAYAPRTKANLVSRKNLR